MLLVVGMLGMPPAMVRSSNKQRCPVVAFRLSQTSDEAAGPAAARAVAAAIAAAKDAAIVG
eukprot:363009-Chlamydomonas_euryale.AAC.4